MPSWCSSPGAKENSAKGEPTQLYLLESSRISVKADGLGMPLPTNISTAPKSCPPSRSGDRHPATSCNSPPSIRPPTAAAASRRWRPPRCRSIRTPPPRNGTRRCSTMPAALGALVMKQADGTTAALNEEHYQRLELAIDDQFSGAANDADRYGFRHRQELNSADNLSE